MSKIHIYSSLEHLPIVNTFIAEQLPSEFSAIIPLIELVAEELLVNVFNYAYEDAKGDIEIKAYMVNFDQEPLFCLQICDWGNPFDPSVNAPTPDITLDVKTRPIGGLGIHLVKSIVKHYCYSYISGANVIDLYFAVPLKSS